MNVSTSTLFYLCGERASERGRHLDIGSKPFHGIDLCLSDFCM